MGEGFWGNIRRPLLVPAPLFYCWLLHFSGCPQNRVLADRGFGGHFPLCPCPRVLGWVSGDQCRRAPRPKVAENLPKNALVKFFCCGFLSREELALSPMFSALNIVCFGLSPIFSLRNVCLLSAAPNIILCALCGFPCQHMAASHAQASGEAQCSMEQTWDRSTRMFEMVVAGMRSAIEGEVCAKCSTFWGGNRCDQSGSPGGGPGV